MEQTMLYLLTFSVILLSLITGFFLTVLISLMLTARRTLKKLQMAIDNVEDAAIQTLAPLVSFRGIFTDFGSFMHASKKIASSFQQKKRK